MSDNVRDWFTAHISIFTDVSTAIFSVEIATREVTRIAGQQRSLTAPAVRQAFSELVADAKACRVVVDRALSLPPIPDVATDVQFRHTMQMQGKWADLMADAATGVDPEGLDRASRLQRQIAQEGGLIMEELRKVWPADDPTLGEA